MAVHRWKVQDEDDASELLDEWRASGLELRDFCEGRGIDGRSLNCWRLNLGLRKPEPTLRLLDVIGPQPAGKAEYRVSGCDVVVQVDDDSCDGTLAQLLRVVAAC